MDSDGDFQQQSLVLISAIGLTFIPALSTFTVGGCRETCFSRVERNNPNARSVSHHDRQGMLLKAERVQIGRQPLFEKKGVIRQRLDVVSVFPVVLSESPESQLQVW